MKHIKAFEGAIDTGPCGESWVLEDKKVEPVIGSGICIRPFKMDDGPAFVAAVLESVETVGMWFPWCHKGYSFAEMETWFSLCRSNLISNAAYDLGIFTAENEGLLGGIAINPIDQTNKIGSIGYWVRESCQGKGIATNALEAIIRFGFNVLHLVRLEIVILGENKASRRVAEKSGAKFECIARNRLMHHGKPMPAAVYVHVP